MYYDCIEDRHPTITTDTYDNLMSWLEEVKEFVDYDAWCDAVDEHFQYLPKSNNGSIIAFSEASFRHFEILNPTQRINF